MLTVLISAYIVLSIMAAIAAYCISAALFFDPDEDKFEGPFRSWDRLVHDIKCHLKLGGATPSQASIDSSRAFWTILVLLIVCTLPIVAVVLLIIIAGWMSRHFQWDPEETYWRAMR